MAKTQPRAKRTNRSRAPARHGGRMMAARAFLWLAVVGLLAAACAVAARTVWSAVASNARFTVQFDRDVELPEFPDWVIRKPMEQLVRDELRAIPGSMSIFETRMDRGRADGAAFRRSAPELVHAALGAIPWIEQVEAVEKVLPNRLAVRLRFRRPAAVVLWEGRRHLVDREGRWLGVEGGLFRLPPDWDAARIPVVIDANLRKRPEPASPWDAPRLAVGARLNEYLLACGLYDRLHVTRIDVTWVSRGAENVRLEGGIQPEVTLVTATGTRVKWGKSSVYADVEGLTPSLTEYPDDDKLRRLLGTLERYRELTDCTYVDLRFRPTAVRRAAAGG